MSISGTAGSSFLAINKLLHAANCNPKSVGPYTNKLDILVVGDGDLSFARALAYSIGGSRVTATCYDSLQAFKAKYRGSLANIGELAQLEVKTHFGVDATRLEEQRWLNDPKKAGGERRQFHRIVFNFPHAGQDDDAVAVAPPPTRRVRKKKDKGDDDDHDDKKDKRKQKGRRGAGGGGGGGVPQQEIVKRNQKLLYEFFVSAAPWLLPGGLGQIHVALRTSTHYKQWQIEDLARKAGLVLKKTEPFQASLFPGYENKRTASADLIRGAPTTDGAVIYMFVWPGPTSPPLPVWPAEVEEEAEDEDDDNEGEGGDDDEEEEEDDEEEEEEEEVQQPKPKPQPKQQPAKQQQPKQLPAKPQPKQQPAKQQQSKQQPAKQVNTNSNNNKSNKRKEREDDGDGGKKGMGKNGGKSGGPAKKARTDGAAVVSDGLSRKERRAQRGGRGGRGRGGGGRGGHDGSAGRGGGRGGGGGDRGGGGGGRGGGGRGRGRGGGRR